MGQITFKGGTGIIQFKDGKITFLSYPPMADPTVTVQLVYDPVYELYKAKVRVVNNDAYNARLRLKVTKGTDAPITDSYLMDPGEDYISSFFSSSKSPDNGTLFKVEAFCEDLRIERPSSATISKQTTANFRRYIYNEGENPAGLSYYTSTGSYTLNEYSDHISLRSGSPTTAAAVTICPEPDSSLVISPSTDRKIWIDWHFISGDNDRDYLEIKYKTTTLAKYLGTFNSGREEESFNIMASGHFYDIHITLSDYMSPGDWPSVSIYKLYIETTIDGPLVE